MEPVPSEESHLFNGKTYSKDCKEWQVCDISDPIISRILSTENLRPECQVRPRFHLFPFDFLSFAIQPLASPPNPTSIYQNPN